MDNSTIFFIILSGIVAFGIIGYKLFKHAKNKYNYNIFNIGITIRGIIAFIILFYDYIAMGEELFTQTGSILFFIVAIALLLWNFIITMKKTNIWIAIISFAYQLFVIFAIIIIFQRIKSFLLGDD